MPTINLEKTSNNSEQWAAISLNNLSKWFGRSWIWLKKTCDEFLIFIGCFFDKILNHNRPQNTSTPITSQEVINKPNPTNFSINNGTNPAVVAAPVINSQAVSTSAFLSNPIAEGLVLSKIKRREGTRILQMVNNWALRDDKVKGDWSQSELAKILDVKTTDIHEICYRLQIIDENIPTKLINYYFRAIQECLLFKKTQTFFNRNFLLDRFEGSFNIVALGCTRYRGCRIKNDWSLDDLAMYLSVNPEFLGNILESESIKPAQNNRYSSGDITKSVLKAVEDQDNYIINSTQDQSLRHISFPDLQEPEAYNFVVQPLLNDLAEYIIQKDSQEDF